MESYEEQEDKKEKKELTILEEIDKFIKDKIIFPFDYKGDKRLSWAEVIAQYEIKIDDVKVELGIPKRALERITKDISLGINAETSIKSVFDELMNPKSKDELLKSNFTLKNQLKLEKTYTYIYLHLLSSNGEDVKKN